VNDCVCSSATLHGSQNRNLPLHASTVFSTAMFFSTCCVPASTGPDLFRNLSRRAAITTRPADFRIAQDTLLLPVATAATACGTVHRSWCAHVSQARQAFHNESQTLWEVHLGLTLTLCCHRDSPRYS
jgi:hypothetical protein